MLDVLKYEHLSKLVLFQMQEFLLPVWRYALPEHLLELLFLCSTAKYMVSCEEAKMLNPLLANLSMYVDIDDSGPLDPFPVMCVFKGNLVSLTCG